jgi:nitroreductase
MDLYEAMRCAPTSRRFTAEPVPRASLLRALDAARFAPSGGNRQGWRVVVVKDRPTRRTLRDLYRPAWARYLAQSGAGLVPWAPLTERDAEREALASAGDTPPPSARAGFTEHLDEVPVLLAVLADLRALAAVDRDHDRYTFAGGASVYPFVWNILLAARGHGLGGVLTTMLVDREPDVLRLLDAPEEYALAAVVALGHPVRQPRRLRRAAVEEFVTVDRFSGPPLAPLTPLADRHPTRPAPPTRPA